ncbi:MAG: hypothetical protein OSJ73_05590 [Lachnospiraceae bacterium]|nr:hypothetical protein [Lachnospiraceae bacterium]
MIYTKKCFPLIIHRLDQVISIPKLGKLCSNLEYRYIEGNFNKNVTDTNMLYLLCGAGLLDKEFINSHRIVNHSCYILLARGLDAYNWSIYYDFLIDVTIHFLENYINVREIIKLRKMKVGEYDTLHSVVQQIYENEIDVA